MTLTIFIVLLFLAAAVPAHAADGGDTSAAADSTARELREIVVTADSATRLSGTSLVTTVAGSALQNVGTCLDLLGRLPMITVKDDAVSVTGKGSPEIYIDGRPLRDADELVQLSSDHIARVELDLAPGAAYDSATDAVIRITTRRSFLDGVSLTARAEGKARRRLTGNGMADINCRNGALDVFMTLTAARNNSLIKGTSTNSLVYEGKPTVVGSRQNKEFPSVNGTAKAGFNYGGDRLSAGAYYRFNPERGDFANRGSEWVDDSEPVARDLYNRIRAHSHLVSAYCDFRPSETFRIHFDGNFRQSRSTDNTSAVYPGGETADVSSSNLRKSRLWAGRLYAAMPLWKGELTAGTASSYTSTMMDYRMNNPEVEQYIPSVLTRARQTSASAFASWKRNAGPLSIGAGVRYEYVDYAFDTDGVRDPDVSRRDHLLTPDLSLGYAFDDRSQLSLSYRMSSVRPPYAQLTGSLAYTGMHLIEGGNPALRDERMHDVQLFGAWRDFILQADFVRSLDTYGFTRRLYPAPGLKIIQQPVNFDVSALSVYLIWNRRIGPWSPSVTAGMYRQWLCLDGTAHNRPIFSYYFDNTLSLPFGFELDINASGSSRGDMHTNRFGGTAVTVDAGLSKSFLSDSLQVRLSAYDIFGTANNDWTMDTGGIYARVCQSYDYRGVGLSVTYRLRPQRSRYKGEAASEAELNRL